MALKIMATGTSCRVTKYQGSVGYITYFELSYILKIVLFHVVFPFVY